MGTQAGEVTRDLMESELDRVLAEADDRAGLFGPDSAVWAVSRHSVVNLGATGLGGVVDGAHPWIAQGVLDHSKLFDDPDKRFESTYSLLNRLVFGDARQVRKVARALYGMHVRVDGTLPQQAARFEAGSTYRANQVEALVWVHLVYFWLRMRLYQELVGDLPEEQWDRFAVESARFGACFGIPMDRLPQDAASLRESFHAFITGDSLGPSAALDEILEQLNSLLPFFARPGFNALCMLILPVEVHRTLHLHDKPLTRRLQRPVRLALRIEIRLMPRSVRFLPAYHEAQHRLGGPKVGWLTRRFNQRLIGRPTVLSTTP